MSVKARMGGKGVVSHDAPFADTYDKETGGEGLTAHYVLLADMHMRMGGREGHPVVRHAAYSGTG